MLSDRAVPGEPALRPLLSAAADRGVLRHCRRAVHGSDVLAAPTVQPAERVVHPPVSAAPGGKVPEYGDPAVHDAVVLPDGAVPDGSALRVRVSAAFHDYDQHDPTGSTLPERY